MPVAASEFVLFFFERDGFQQGDLAHCGKSREKQELFRWRKLNRRGRAKQSSLFHAAFKDGSRFTGREKDRWVERQTEESIASYRDSVLQLVCLSALKRLVSHGLATVFWSLRRNQGIMMHTTQCDFLHFLTEALVNASFSVEN